MFNGPAKYLYTISTDRKGNVCFFTPSMFMNRLQPDEIRELTRLFVQDRAEFDLLMRQLAEMHEFEYEQVCRDETAQQENR